MQTFLTKKSSLDKFVQREFASLLCKAWNILAFCLFLIHYFSRTCQQFIAAAIPTWFKIIFNAISFHFTSHSIIWWRPLAAVTTKNIRKTLQNITDNIFTILTDNNKLLHSYYSAVLKQDLELFDDFLYNYMTLNIVITCNFLICFLLVFRCLNF